MLPARLSACLCCLRCLCSVQSDIEPHPFRGSLVFHSSAHFTGLSTPLSDNELFTAYIIPVVVTLIVLFFFFSVKEKEMNY